MILIFGGVYQGKLSYALERFGADENQIYQCSEKDAAIPGGKKILYEIDRWILALIRADAKIAECVSRLIENNRDAVVICNDISSGIVPVDEEARRWREATGRAMAALAGQSDEVVRLYCGIPSRVK